MVAELLAVVSAIALSAVVAMDGDPLPADLRVTRWAGNLPAFHSIALAFRWGMGTEGVLAMGAVIAAPLWLWRRRREAGALVLALLVLRVVQPLIKNVVDRERPSEDLVDRRAGFNSESFPSGHMMSAVVFCGVLTAIVWSLPLGSWRQWALTAGLAALILLNGQSSIYMGVHWPSDILGGIFWGLVIVIPAGAAVLMCRREPD